MKLIRAFNHLSLVERLLNDPEVKVISLKIVPHEDGDIFYVIYEKREPWDD
ncbi:MAG: hypothetical protein QIT36_gp030 [Methanophagales virus GBV301]|uniref:Uncharacterized protein n=1 Tax=Methanophagales virus GBV301 TaxID=2999280 RepID=A0A9E8V964_9CAUD|nr:MAG: hypothetical protein QIT36_gp030 [Methanophagales virus GBV301]WAE39454.1 MAG: hypothetical protein LDLAKGPJ_00030 [Methanophagales virus GBV301]